MSEDFVQALSEALEAHSGVVLVCAPTGQGKTSSVVRALEHRCTTGVHVLVDRHNFDEPEFLIDGLAASGVRLASSEELRHSAPGTVIMAGDIRSPTVAFGAFDLAQRGALVVATLRIPSAAGAFGRLVDMGLDRRVLAQLVLVSFGVRLLSGVNGNLTVFEWLNVTSGVRRLIASGATTKEVVNQAVDEGMKTLRQRALDLVADGLVSLDCALSSTPAE